MKPDATLQVEITVPAEFEAAVVRDLERRPAAAVRAGPTGPSPEDFRHRHGSSAKSRTTTGVVVTFVSIASRPVRKR